MVVFIESFKQSMSILKKEWRSIPLSVLFDFIFIFCFGIATTMLAKSSANPLQSLVEAGGRLAGELSSAALSGQSPLDVFLADPTVAFSLNALIVAFITFVLLLYTFWIFFSGTTWYLSYRMTEKKTLFKSLQFITKFALVSAVWFLAYTLMASFIVRFIGHALLRPDQILSSSTVSFGANILHFVLFYFMFLSLAFVPYTSFKENFKKTFTKGFTQFVTIIVVYGIIIAAFYANFKVTEFIFTPLTFLPALAISLLRFLLAAPFLVWARIYLMTTAKKIK